MGLKRTLTNVAVDSARDYFLEKLEQIKKLDLDHDGHRDVDQIAAHLIELGKKLNEAVESTDFQKLATGLEQVVAGANLIGSSIDRQKMSAAGLMIPVTLKK